ncbi:MAG: PIN domain-containing protein [Anaerolineae bacterium]|jgi:PIN domain nuclease of toxin-antitoxin system|uniref:type II toxin-antitoxin system VapC family toxin n=1 Tax=Candidatus Amarolinea dominans TaxID=3140696 RepID=UPI0031CCB6F2
MIVLDTHIWVWWVHGDERLSQTRAEIIETHEADVIGVSAISCWEIAKLVEYGRLELPCAVDEMNKYTASGHELRLFPWAEK